MSEHAEATRTTVFSSTTLGPASWWRGTAEERASPRAPLRPGRKAVLLSVSNARGAAVAVTFTPARGGVHVWRSLSPQRERLRHVATLPGRFTPLAIARHVASDAVEPVVNEDLVENIQVDGVDDLYAALIRLAWSRKDGKVDPRVAVVLRLSQAQLDEVSDRLDAPDEESLLKLGAYLASSDAAWLAKWKAEIDVEVDRRAELEGAGEERRRELRAFVEECLLVLGRIPRNDESPSSWDGAGSRDNPPGKRGRRKLGLTETGRVRRYRIRVHFWAASVTYGYDDFGPGPGWYFVVANPNPLWRFCDPTGSYKTPAEAWGDAAMIGEGEE